jgi:hypothetical protein
MAQNFQLSNFANFIVANGASNTVTIANNLTVNSSAMTVNGFNFSPTDLTVSSSLRAGSNNLFVNSTTLSVTNSGITANGVITDNKGDVRDIPVNVQTSLYQLSTTDNGRVISTTANVTVNGAILTVGEAFSIYNNSSANITVVSGSGVTMYLGGTASTGNRTLAQRGLATVLMVASNTFVISGAGLT